MRGPHGTRFAQGLFSQAWPSARRIPQPEGKSPMEAVHANALQSKHAGLERRIHEEMTRPQPDPVAIKMLKQQKLRIKDELTHN